MKLRKNKLTMETTTAIERKISTASKQSEAIIRKDHQSWQEKVDRMLDRMNELGSHLTTLHKVVLFLTFEVERDFENFKKSDVARTDLKNLVRLLVPFLTVVRKSDLYPGVKSTYSTLKGEVSYLNELLSDSKVSDELDQDEEWQNLIKASL